MARRMIKFPLKMKNGAEVRNLEDLRANADVESIMKYYFSGQLSLWCRAFGYENIPAGITEINERFVTAVMDLIGVKASAEEMQKYIKNSFGAIDTSKITEDIENEEEIIDNMNTKENDIYNKIKNDQYSELKVGDTFEFGKFKGESIIWTIFKKTNNTLCVISNNVLCRKAWNREKSNNWQNSSIRKWLNNDFYNGAFNVSWWLKSSNTSDISLVDNVHYNGDFGNASATGLRYIRPVLNLKF